MRKHAYFVAEGIHDVEFIGKLLRRIGYDKISRKDDVDEYWYPLIPLYPKQNLLQRDKIPLFFQNADISLAVDCGGGDIEELTNTVYDRFAIIEPSEIVGVAVFVDADYRQGGALKRFEETKKKLTQKITQTLNWPDSRGKVSISNPNAGIFILPDNKNDGTIETILKKCAEIVYSELYNGASAFVNSVNQTLLEADDKKDFLKPAGKDKAIIGCVGNILKPGKAVQVSISDNKWVCDDTCEIGEIKLLDIFIKKILV